MRRMMQIRVIHTEVNVEQGVVKGSQSNQAVFNSSSTHTLTKPHTGLLFQTNPIIPPQPTLSSLMPITLLPTHPNTHLS